MSLPLSYAFLAVAIICEVLATSLLPKTEQFTRLIPTLGMGVIYAASFFLLSHALKGIPLGVAYAIWGGLGIVLTAGVSVFYYRQPLDMYAVLGIGLIVSGVVVMNVMSKTAAH